MKQNKMMKSGLCSWMSFSLLEKYKRPVHIRIS